MILFQLFILLIIYWFQPISSSILTRHLNGQMLEPAVFGSAMPMLDTLVNIHYITGMKLTGFFAPFLIPAAAADTDEHLAAALAGGNPVRDDGPRRHDLRG